MKSSRWFVYIIKNELGHLYTGITTDIERRFSEHADSSKGAKFFRRAAPVDVVFRKEFPNRSEASKCEARIKKLRRAKKLEIIQKGEL